MMQRRSTYLRLVVAPVLLLGGCGVNLLPNPESRAVALPTEVDVAVGSTHDVLVAACQDRVTITDVLLPAAATTLFVGFGRLDALFYYPEAQINALIPECDPVAYEVSDPAFDTAGFELSATPNPKAFQAHARAEGPATFSAEVRVGGEVLEVQSTLRAHVPNRVALTPRCDGASLDSTEQLEGYWLPAGTSVTFSQQLYRDELPLKGYGLSGIASTEVTLPDFGGSAVIQLPARTGPLTFSSPFDPSFELTVHLYDESAFDELDLAPPSAGDVFVGQVFGVKATTTIGGKRPCVLAFPRTATIETPSICRFQQSMDPAQQRIVRSGQLAMEALAPGACAVRMELPGTALSDRVEFPVYTTFTAVPFEASIDSSIGLQDLFVTPEERVIVGWKDHVSGFYEAAVITRREGEAEKISWPQGVKTLYAVHGGPDGSLFAAGGDGKVVRRNGNTWEVFSTGTTERLTDIWVFSATDVYVAGENGVLLHFDGDSWTPIDTGTTARITSLWGASPDDLWIAGWGMTLLRYRDGTLENAYPPNAPASFDAINSISGRASNDLWVLDNDTVMRFTEADGWTVHPVALLNAGDSRDVLRKIHAMPDGTAYALMGRLGSVPASHAVWLGGPRNVAFPVNATGAIASLGDQVYAMSGKALFRLTHAPEIF